MTSRRAAERSWKRQGTIGADNNKIVCDGRVENGPEVGRTGGHKEGTGGVQRARYKTSKGTGLVTAIRWRSAREGKRRLSQRALMPKYLFAKERICVSL